MTMVRQERVVTWTSDDAGETNVRIMMYGDTPSREFGPGGAYVLTSRFGQWVQFQTWESAVGHVEKETGQSPRLETATTRYESWTDGTGKHSAHRLPGGDHAAEATLGTLTCTEVGITSWERAVESGKTLLAGLYSLRQSAPRR